MIPSRHRAFDDLLNQMSQSGVSMELLGKVLARVMIATPDPLRRPRAVAAGVPRTDLASGSMLFRAKALSPGTVSRAVSTLISFGFLKEGDPQATRAGRPITPLFFSRERWGLLGFHVAQPKAELQTVTGVLTTLDGEALVGPLESTVDHDGDRTPAEALVDAIVDVGDRLLDEARRQSLGREVLGAGVEVSGHVRGGVLVKSGSTGPDPFGGIDLEWVISQRMGLPVVLENDVNSYAVVKSYSHEYPEPDMAIVVVFDEGVGGALIIDGDVFRGSSGMAGEIGHLAVEEEQSPEAISAGPCNCGRLGHIDALATPARILRQLDDASLDTAAASPGRTDGQISASGQVFASAGRALGKGLVHLIDLFNPGRLLVSLPPALATARAGTAGAEYRYSLEAAVEGAFSTGASDAKLTFDDSLSSENATELLAIAAAVRVLDCLVQHARGRDDCAYPSASPGPYRKAG